MTDREIKYEYADIHALGYPFICNRVSKVHFISIYFSHESTKYEKHIIGHILIKKSVSGRIITIPYYRVSQNAFILIMNARHLLLGMPPTIQAPAKQLNFHHSQ